MAGTRCSHSSRNISELLVEHGKTFLVRLTEVKLMCTGIVENTRVSGSGRGPEGWFPLNQASVSYDHPDHTPSERARDHRFPQRDGWTGIQGGGRTDS